MISYYKDAGELLPDEVQFLADHPAAMVYHQPAWLMLIADITGARVGYVFVRAEMPIAAFPICERIGQFGIVANSSAYFGSHGGALVANDEAMISLMEAVQRHLASRQIETLNIIDPLFGSAPTYKKYLSVDCEDERDGHYIDLKAFSGDDELVLSFDGLVRSNLRRKALRSGIVVERDESADSLKSVAALHFREMSAKDGGLPKSDRFFTGLMRLFPDNMRLYVGRIDGCVAAALLVVCWREWVEYLVPVFEPEYRDMQPSSAVLYHALRECRAQGFHWWNFGGTWKAQHGVRKFKESWGAKTQPYRYSIVDLGGLQKMRDLDKSVLLTEYNGFYVFPF